MNARDARRKKRCRNAGIFAAMFLRLAAARPAMRLRGCLKTKQRCHSERSFFRESERNAVEEPCESTRAYPTNRKRVSSRAKRSEVEGSRIFAGNLQSASTLVLRDSSTSFRCAALHS